MKFIVLSFTFLFCAIAFGQKPETQQAIPETWFPHADGSTTKGEFIDLNSKTKERLYIRYGPISDSGVELERANSDGKIVWRTQVKPLGVKHSKYNHEVWIRIDDGKIQVTSIGSKTIIEVIELETGKQLSRSIHETKER